MYVCTHIAQGYLTDIRVVPHFSVHPEELQESAKSKLNDRGYFYANSNAGLGWTDKANRSVYYPYYLATSTDGIDITERRSTNGASYPGPL